MSAYQSVLPTVTAPAAEKTVEEEVIGKESAEEPMTETSQKEPPVKTTEEPTPAMDDSGELSLDELPEDIRNML